jgi:hypothetical protein
MGMIELRCENKLHGTMEDDVIEVRCDSRWCGKRPGVVVIHRFSIKGDLLETLRFKSPPHPAQGRKKNAFN